MAKINPIHLDHAQTLDKRIDEIRTNYPVTEMAKLYVHVRQNAQGGVACCPFHDDRNPSFSIFANHTRFHCHGCGVRGDVIDFVMRVHGVNFSQAITLLSEGTISMPEPITNDPSDNVDRVDEARSIFEQAVASEGTPAETYLRARGIKIPIPSSIRYAVLQYHGRGEMPCLVAALQNISGEVTGVQRTFLLPDGTDKAKVAKPKLSLGKVSGSAVHLDPNFGSGEAVVCEGLEDGLSLAQLMEASVWVAAGASMLANMEFPISVTSIIIASDNDYTGMMAAKKAAEIFFGRGLPVRLFRPLDEFKDFNDELRGIKS